MRIKHKKLLVLLIILAVLIVAYIALSTSEDPGISGKLFSIEGQQVEWIELKNNYGEYDFTLENGAWTVSENGQSYRTNPQKMKLMLDSLNDFTLSRVLDQEIGLYGFEEPVANVTLRTDAGEEYAFLVGNTTASASSIYVKDAKSNVVGITATATVAQLDGSLSAYRDKNVFTIDSTNLRQLVYYKAGQPAIGLVSNGENWYLSHPYEAPANALAVNELLAMINGWTIAGFPDMEQIDETDMGLADTSDALILVDANGNKQMLQFGGTSGSATFVRTGGEGDVAMLYTADIDFTGFDEQNLLFVTPLRAPLERVSTMTIMLDGQEYELKADHAAKTASQNGRLIDYEDFVGIYYKYILLVADGRDAAGPKDKTVVAQMRTTADDGQELNLTLVPRDESTYFMVLSDGTSVYYMNRQRLEALAERIAAVNGN